MTRPPATTDCIRRPHSYWTTCDCEPCRLDSARKHKLYTTGRAWRVPADIANQALIARLDDGWTALALASATGLRSDHFMRHVTAHRNGAPLPTLGPAVAAAVVNMGAPTAGHIGARGARRRLQGLAVIGYGLQDIADHSGVGFSTLAMIRRGSTVRIKATMHNRIAATYAELEMRPGSNRAVRNNARANGWASPLVWDDIDRDSDPTEDHHYVDSTRAERFADLAEQGAGVTEVATRLGLTRRALEKWAQRNGHNDTYSQLVARETAVFEQGRNQHARRGAA